jgi:hypothetical protein
LPRIGRPVQERRSGHARAVPGCHHHPAARTTYPATVRLCRAKMSKRGAHPCPDGNCGGNTRPAAGGERTLMGPAPQLPSRPQKRLSPHAGPSAETNERARGWKVGLRLGGDELLAKSRPSKHEHRRAPTGSPPLGPPSDCVRRCLAAAVPGQGSLMPPSSHEPTEWGIGREYPIWRARSDRHVGQLVRNFCSRQSRRRGSG